MHNRAYFMVGPTAVGKTRVGVWAARELGCDVLSADSMYVYRGMDIGTSKPTVPERERVPHHGLDLVDPCESCSVGTWRAHVAQLIAARREQKVERPLVVVGGTGLYVKSLVSGFSDLPDVTEETRAHWRHVAEQGGVSELQSALQSLNPAFFDALEDRLNARRLQRALELASSGMRHPPREWSEAPDADIRLTGLRMEREALIKVIEARVQAMYRQGLSEEVEALLRRYGAFSETAAKAIGYAEVAEALRGGCSVDEAMSRTAVRTRRLAKRQRTWFEHQLKVDWIDVTPKMSVEEIGRRVLSHWEQAGPVTLSV